MMTKAPPPRLGTVYRVITAQHGFKHFSRIHLFNPHSDMMHGGHHYLHVTGMEPEAQRD